MVQLINLRKEFKNHAAIKDISLDIRKGEFLTLLGPSGCGKTTTLRIIAGFEDPSSGKVLIDNEDVSYRQPHERDVNTVFQSYALFPHMNIFNNIAFGLKIKKLSSSEIKQKVLEVLKLVQLEGFENRYPSQLSGGQKQRVAIARAIVNSPKVLLLDEPLGALDLKLRKQMQYELKHLQQKLGITFIYVTHDQEEALTMSDRIAVMNNGIIEQVGVPDEIYERPKTKFVADFIGETNIFEAKVKSIEGDILCIEIEDGQKVSLKSNMISHCNVKEEDSILMIIRPERMQLSYLKTENKNIILGNFKERIYVGSSVKTVVTLKNGREIIINEPAGHILELHDSAKDIYVSWEYDHAVVIMP